MKCHPDSPLTVVCIFIKMERDIYIKTENVPNMPSQDSFKCFAALNRHKCECCDLETHFLVDLKRHRNEPRSKHRCKNCNYASFSKLVLLKHYQKHDWYECDKCVFKSLWKQSLKKHNEISHAAPEDVKWLKCAECSFETKRGDSLRRHVLTIHIPDDAVWFECDKCPYRSTLKMYVKKHMSHNHLKLYECDKCPYKSKQKVRLEVHIRRWHPAPEDRKWFLCECCSYKTVFRSALKRHFKAKHKCEG